MKSSIFINTRITLVVRLWDISLNSRQWIQNWKPTALVYLYLFLVQHLTKTEQRYFHQHMATSDMLCYKLYSLRIQRFKTICRKDFTQRLFDEFSRASFRRGKNLHNSDLWKTAFTEHLVCSSIHLAASWILLYLIWQRQYIVTWYESLANRQWYKEEDAHQIRMR